MENGTCLCIKFGVDEPQKRTQTITTTQGTNFQINIQLKVQLKQDFFQKEEEEKECFNTLLSLLYEAIQLYNILHCVKVVASVQSSFYLGGSKAKTIH